jgi:hypothetical protein
MRVLTFSAIVHDGKLELQPGFVTDGEPWREKGELTVEALGRGRRPLARTALPLQAPCAPRGGEPARAAFGLVDFPEKATGLRVSLGNEVLLEQAAPRDFELSVEWPATVSGAVRWRASAKGCIASLGYSNDGGETWTPLVLPGPANTIEVDATHLAGGRECLLELIVTDGFHTHRVRSGLHEVEPKGWVLWILSPAPGATLAVGEPVLLAAQGYHLEERRAGFDGIEWRSSLGGGLGTGARLLAALEPGEHAITAAMHDARAVVAVSVG